MTEFIVRLETPWKEPQGFAEPTARQFADGVVICFTASMSGGEHSIRRGDYYLVDPKQADRYISAGYARFETEREERIAKAEGYKRPNRSVKSKAPKAKAKAKAESSEEADGGEG